METPTATPVSTHSQANDLIKKRRTFVEAYSTLVIRAAITSTDPIPCPRETRAAPTMMAVRRVFGVI